MGRRTCDNRGSESSDVSVNQGTPGIPSKLKKPGRGKKESCPSRFRACWHSGSGLLASRPWDHTFVALTPQSVGLYPGSPGTLCLLFTEFNSFSKPATYILNFDKDFQITFWSKWTYHQSLKQWTYHQLVVRVLISPRVYHYWSYKIWPLWWLKNISSIYLFKYISFSNPSAQ